MAELEEQISVIVATAVKDILRLVGRDDIHLADLEDFIAETPTSSSHNATAAVPPRPRMSGSKDPILDNFLGTNR